jgi:hypothetical protein
MPKASSSRYVVRSGDEYGEFDSQGDQYRPEVRSVVWMSGKVGRNSATKFLTQEAAEFAAAQVTDRGNIEVIHLPRVSPNLRYIIGTDSPAGRKKYWLCKFREGYVWRSGPSGERNACKFRTAEEAQEMIDAGYSSSHGLEAKVFERGW